MTGLPGAFLDPGTKDLISRFGISNFIIFSKNTKEGPDALKRLCHDIESACVTQGLYPLIAVDQEGGPVRRLMPPLFPDMGSATGVLSSSRPRDAMRELAWTTASMLKDVGINMNLSPVLDLCLEAEGHVLRGRCLGREAEQVAELGTVYIEELQGNGIVATAKHFPGIGMAMVDPHLERAMVRGSDKKIWEGLIPFRQAIKAGVAAVMTSHVVFTAIDPSRPATFSRKIATKILRRDLGFKGLLLSDDLEMKGATAHEAIGQAAVDACLAGHDLLLVCNNQENVIQCLESLRQAYETGVLSKTTVEASCQRIRLAQKTVHDRETRR